MLLQDWNNRDAAAKSEGLLRADKSAAGVLHIGNGATALCGATNVSLAMDLGNVGCLECIRKRWKRS